MNRVVSLSISVLLAFSWAAAQQGNPVTTVITDISAGKAKLGITVADVRKAVAPLKLERTSDGEGVALIAVKRGKDTTMTLYAGEQDRDAKIDEKARVSQIWVRDKSYRTAGGARVGMTIPEVEKRYGKLKAIVRSEVESREFAFFADHPKGIYFLMQGPNGPAGVYPEGSRQTTSYDPAAAIAGFNIVGDSYKDPSGPETPSRFSSVYTDLRTGCKTVGGNEGGHVSTFCIGPGGYQIHMFDSATTLEFNAENEDEDFQIRLASEALDYVSRNSKIEWRLADGKPFAVIMRSFIYRTEGEFPKQGNPIGAKLVVKGLDGYSRINTEIDATVPHANQKAREAADAGFSAVPANDARGTHGPR